jgi:hypothetical protein
VLFFQSSYRAFFSIPYLGVASTPFQLSIPKTPHILFLQAPPPLTQTPNHPPANIPLQKTPFIENKQAAEVRIDILPLLRKIPEKSHAWHGTT